MRYIEILKKNIHNDRAIYLRAYSSCQIAELMKSDEAENITTYILFNVNVYG